MCRTTSQHSRAQLADERTSRRDCLTFYIILFPRDAKNKRIKLLLLLENVARVINDRSKIPTALKRSRKCLANKKQKSKKLTKFGLISFRARASVVGFATTRNLGEHCRAFLRTVKPAISRIYFD